MADDSQPVLESKPKMEEVVVGDGKGETFANNFQDIDLNTNDAINKPDSKNKSNDPLTSVGICPPNNTSKPAESAGKINAGSIIKMAILDASRSETKNLKSLTTANGSVPNEAVVKPYNVQNGGTHKPPQDTILYPYVIAKSASPDLRHKAKSKLDGSSYARGDLMVTVRPVKSSCVWITPAKFDVHSVPVEFMDPKLAITADDYNMALEFLTNDYRFNCYNICYRRIILSWLLFGFFILIAILFSKLNGAVLFGMGIIWLLINTVGIFVCLFIKKRMNTNLDDAVSTINRVLVKKNVLAGLEDQGKLSCHKIMIHFVYYDINDCMTEMTQVLEKKGLKNKQGKDILNGIIKNGKTPATDNEAQCNADVEEIIDGNSTNLKLNYYQNYAEKVLLRNSQSYIKNLIKGRLTIPHPELPTSKTIRHVKGNFCLCQYVEDYYFLGKESKWYHAFF